MTVLIVLLTLAVAVAIAGAVVMRLPQRPRYDDAAMAARGRAREHARLSRAADQQLQWALSGDLRALYGRHYRTIEERIERLP